MIHCFDPGVTTGYVSFDNEGVIKTWDQMTRDQVYKRTAYINPSDLVICEDYRIKSHQFQQNVMSKLDTVRLIGVLEYVSWKVGAKFVLQDPSNKAIGYKYGFSHGLREAKSHAQSHWRDAAAHGYYYLVQNGVL